MLNKTIMKFLGIVFGVLILGFTGMQTFSLLHAITGSVLLSTIGLILFEGGLLYWWAIFQSSAEGLGQMALSAILAGFGLVLVVMAVALELGAVAGDALGDGTGAKLIVAAAIVNLIGKFLYPLLSPDVSENIFLRTMEGKITSKAYKDAEKTTDELAVGLATTVSLEIARRVEFKLLTAYGLDASGAERKALPSTAENALNITPAADENEADDDNETNGIWAALVAAVRGNKTAVNEPVVIDQELDHDDGVDDERVEPVRRQLVNEDDSRVDLPDGEIAAPPFANGASANGSGQLPN